MKTRRWGRFAPFLALTALMLSVLAPMTAFAENVSTSADSVCNQLGYAGNFPGDGDGNTESGDWGSITAVPEGSDDWTITYDINDGYELEICLKKGSGDGSIRIIENVTGIGTADWDGVGFSHYGWKLVDVADPDVDVVVSKSWINTLEAGVSWPSGFTIDVLVTLFASNGGVSTGTALDSDTLTLSGSSPSLTATFPDLVDGDEYVIEWEETGVTMTGGTAGCEVETSIGEGSEPFTAGTDDEVLITAVNTIDCPSTVAASKVWEQDGSEASVPPGFAPAFEIELYRIGEGEESVVLDEDVLEPGDKVSLGELSFGEYRLDWVETGIDFESSFSNSAGDTCRFVGSETSGSVSFDTFGSENGDLRTSDYYLPLQQDISFTGVNRYECQPTTTTQVPESVTVAIEKVWDGVGADEVGTSPEFEITFGATTRTIGVDGSTTFGGLVDGDSYTVAWTELTDALPAVFENEAGQTCTFVPDESTTEGSETFIAGEVNSLTFDAVNLYSCVEAEILIAIPVQVDKLWATADGDEQMMIDAPDGAAVTFTVDLYDGGELIRTVEDLAPGASHLFEELPQEGDYSVQWTEEGAPATITVDDLSCDIDSADGEITGTMDEGFDIEVTNVYECEEPDEETEVEVLGVTETLPKTGFSALLLSLMGLLGVGLGGGMLRRNRRE